MGDGDANDTLGLPDLLQGDWWRDPTVFLTVFELSLDLIVVLNDDLTVRYANPAADRTFAYDDEDLGSVLDLVHPDDVVRVVDELDSGRPAGRALFRMRDATGQWRWLEGTGVDLRDKDEVRGIVVVARDVTELRAKTAALAESEERYRTVVETLAEGVMVFDEHGRVMSMNPAAERILGRSRAELEATPSSEQYWQPLDEGGDVIPLERRPIELTLRTGRSQRGVVLSPNTPSGRHVWLSVNTTLIPGPGDDPLGVVCSFTDITEIMASQAVLLTSEQRFRSLVAESPDIVLTITAEGVARYVSPAVQHLLGYSPGDLVGTTVFELIHPDDQETSVARILRVLEGSEQHELTRLRVRTRDGDYRWVEIVVSNRLEDPVVKGITVNARDITDRVEIERELETEHDRYERLVEELPDLVMRLDHELSLVYANPVARQALGDGTAAGYVCDDDRTREAVEAARRTGRPAHAERQVTGRAGEPRWFDVTVLPERGPAGEVTHLTVISRDVTPYRAEQLRLRQQTLQDGLTGLANRAAFEQQLHHALDGLHLHAGVVSMLFLDLDRFKYVNDSLGHQAGDQLLVAVADRFRAAVRPGDLVARFGGDEFAVLPDRVHDEEEVARLAQRIHELLLDPIRIGETEVRISASIGIATCDSASAVAASTLIQQADMAMYRAKREGRARTARHGDGTG